MGVRLLGPGEPMDIDLGELGYSDRLVVHSNEEVTAEALAREDATMVYAQAALDRKAWWVYFSTFQNGNGNASRMEMAEEDARKYPVGARVLFHYRRHQPAASWMPPGWGELVAISVADDQAQGVTNQTGSRE